MEADVEAATRVMDRVHAALVRHPRHPARTPRVEQAGNNQQAYAAGLTTTREVLDAQLVYAQSRVEANAALYDLAIARARLTQLLGGDKL